MLQKFLNGRRPNRNRELDRNKVTHALPKSPTGTT